jgi:hypothetical protein
MLVQLLSRLLANQRALWRTCFVLALLKVAILAPAVHGADGQHWPFTPPLRPAVPQVGATAWARNPIDAFVLRRLEEAHLRPNPPADRAILLRRVTFDLTGLAPAPGEIANFLADKAPDAYERVVDRLLASPHFGERWAQHWLDVVRYADTDGYKLDHVRPEAYRYRDYVIRAFNTDLPYDRFLSQQIAGDELESENPDALTAVGFFRLPAEDLTASDFRQARQNLLDDVTDTFSLTFLGLTMGCARCHDHKFDPLTQVDYYRLQAFFAPLVHREAPLGTPEAIAIHAREEAVWREATRTIRADIDALLDPVRKDLFAEVTAVFDPDTQAALRTAPANRTPLQQQLAVLAGKQLDRRYARAYRRLSPGQRTRLDQLEKRLASFAALAPQPLPTADSVSDAGPDAPVTCRLAGGNLQRPHEHLSPGFPHYVVGDHAEVHPHRTASSTGRRSALAQWLCRPDHPLTARVIANRLWQHHLGQGIVATPNDFGRMGAAPSDPQLLDFLATHLIEHSWSLKALHRLIVTSASYQQSSAPEHNPTQELATKKDPANRLLWHGRVKRREAESIRDVALQAAGRLNIRMHGPAAQPELPPALMESRYAWDPDACPEDRNRRSVYVLARRNLTYPLFGAFDSPDRHLSCPARAATITAPQALVMLNSAFTLTKARYTAGRLLAAHPRDIPGLVRDAYRTLFGRDPDSDEVQEALAFLDRQARRIGSAKSTVREPLPETPPQVSAALADAVVDFCHALLNSAEFLYVE